MCGKYQKGRQNIKSSNSGNEVGVIEWEEGRGEDEWVTALRGALDRMGTGCHFIFGKLNTNKK